MCGGCDGRLCAKTEGWLAANAALRFRTTFMGFNDGIDDCFSCWGDFSAFVPFQSQTCCVKIWCGVWCLLSIVKWRKNCFLDLFLHQWRSFDNSNSAGAVLKATNSDIGQSQIIKSCILNWKKVIFVFLSSMLIYCVNLGYVYTYAFNKCQHMHLSSNPNTCR